VNTVSGVGTLDKAVQILDAVAGGPLGLAELTERTRLPRATLHRLAAALEDHGLLSRDGGRRYVLGPRLAALGMAADVWSPLAARVRPILVDLTEVTGESAQLYVRQGDHRLCVAAVDSPNELRTIVPVGALLPLDRGSGGTVLTAGAGAPPWVESVAERAPGVASVSAPVVDASGRVVAAVSVSGPIARIGRRPGRRFGEDVAAAARRASLLAGGAETA
jgi:DNA-binding IclR family transcriptional regulator